MHEVVSDLPIINRIRLEPIGAEEVTLNDLHVLDTSESAYARFGALQCIDVGENRRTVVPIEVLHDLPFYCWVCGPSP